MGVTQFLSDAFLANQVRGIDSSGILQLKDGAWKTLKNAVSGTTFVQTGAVQEILKDAGKSEATICHVRAATHGKITTDNAHPFRAVREEGTSVIGVHNGTLTSWENHDDSKDYAVDSEWAYHMIAKHGIEAFKYFNGAYAFVWIDEADKDHVYMARNDKRPLHYMVTNSGRSIVGASEAGMLGWLAERRDLKLHNAEGMDNIYSISPGYLYKFSIKDIGKYEREKLPDYDYRLLPFRSTGYTGYWDDSDWGHRSPYMVGSPYNRNAEYRGYTRPANSRYYYGQTAILTAVKAALKKARSTKVTEEKVKNLPVPVESEVVDGQSLDEEFEQNLLEEIERYQNRKGETGSPFSYLAHYVNSANTSSAGIGEVQAVQRLKGKLFLRVVDFTGVWYDEETSKGYGYFMVHDENGHERSYDAEIRFTNKTEFETSFGEDAKKRALSAVIGYNLRGLKNSKNKYDPTFIVSRLNPDAEMNVLRLMESNTTRAN